VFALSHSPLPGTTGYIPAAASTPTYYYLPSIDSLTPLAAGVTAAI